MSTHFRPCIDIHNGAVKQIVGESLRDAGNTAAENFVSQKGAEYYADLYKREGLRGGHVIMLNSTDSPYYEATKQQALRALEAYPNGLQIGGGINCDNAEEFILGGASHVIVTSYIFNNGQIHFDRLEKLYDLLGRGRIVLDLSCRAINNSYYIATDRWQNITDIKVDGNLLNRLSQYCAEFLVHAVDMEGKAGGIDERLIVLLADSPIEVTYAGGISSYEDIRKIKEIGKDCVNFTVGSKLDIFGGNLSIEEIIACIQ